MTYQFTLILGQYEVNSANSKSEGLRTAKRQHFDLILLDYHLRDGRGPDLSKQEYDPNIPILFVTGTYTMSSREVLEAGAQGVIKKTEIADVLPRAVHEIFAMLDRKASPDDELLLISRRCIEQREQLAKQRARLSVQQRLQREFQSKLMRNVITANPVLRVQKGRLSVRCIWQSMETSRPSIFSFSLQKHTVGSDITQRGAYTVCSSLRIHLSTSGPD